MLSEWVIQQVHVQNHHQITQMFGVLKQICKHQIIYFCKWTRDLVPAHQFRLKMCRKEIVKLQKFQTIAFKGVFFFALKIIFIFSKRNVKLKKYFISLTTLIRLHFPVSWWIDLVLFHNRNPIQTWRKKWKSEKTFLLLCGV